MSSGLLNLAYRVKPGESTTILPAIGGAQLDVWTDCFFPDSNFPSIDSCESLAMAKIRNQTARCLELLKKREALYAKAGKQMEPGQTAQGMVRAGLLVGGLTVTAAPAIPIGATQTVVNDEPTHSPPKSAAVSVVYGVPKVVDEVV